MGEVACPVEESFYSMKKRMAACPLHSKKWLHMNGDCEWRIVPFRLNPRMAWNVAILAQGLSLLCFALPPSPGFVGCWSQRYSVVSFRLETMVFCCLLSSPLSMWRSPECDAFFLSPVLIHTFCCVMTGRVWQDVFPLPCVDLSDVCILI